jgi:hypothetical protein
MGDREYIRESDHKITELCEKIEHMRDEQKNLKLKLENHIKQEDDTFIKVADFLRDLKGFDRILRYIGIGSKWIVMIATLGGLLFWLWDKLKHLKVYL